MHFDKMIYMGGISRDVKKLKMWDFYLLFPGFSLPFTFLFDENYHVL